MANPETLPVPEKPLRTEYQKDNPMPETTRKKLTWTGLTPRDAWNTGDVVDVWYDDTIFRGVYIGIIHRFNGSDWAEVEDIWSDRSRLYRLTSPATIRLVYPSRPIVPCELAVDVYEPVPIPQSDLAVLRRTWSVVALCVAVWAFGIAWITWQVWR